MRGAGVALIAVAVLVCAGAAQVPSAAPGAATAGEPGSGGGSAGPVSSGADVTSVQEIARLEGQAENILRGVGIVTGLKGTGDSGADLVLARPMAAIYERNGNPLPDLKDLAKAKAAALVAIECIVPPQGARVGDNLDVFVTASHSATSLSGGRLFLAPLSGPLPGQGVFAFASGPLVLEDTAVPTVARIRGGARVAVDLLQPVSGEQFTLILHPHFRSFNVADQLADAINSLGPDSDPGNGGGEAGGASAAAAEPIARAVDDVTVRVTVPQAERTNPTKFIAKVMSATFSPSLLRLPAQVIVNQRTGSIIVTGNVEISAVAIAHKGLVVTTTTPAPVATPVTPITSTTKWTSMQTTERPTERAKVQDLLSAFKSLDIPVDEQISILTQIHRAGRLHAKLIVE